MELTMSANLQLSLRQLVPIDCGRAALGGPVVCLVSLSFFFSFTFYFSLARRLGSLPVEILTPRARDCRATLHVHRLSDEFFIKLLKGTLFLYAVYTGIHFVIL